MPSLSFVSNTNISRMDGEMVLVSDVLSQKEKVCLVEIETGDGVLIVHSMIINFRLRHIPFIELRESGGWSFRSLRNICGCGRRRTEGSERSLKDLSSPSECSQKHGGYYIIIR